MSSSSSSSGQGGATQHNYDLTGPSLTKLYNSKVEKAERFRRPLAGFGTVMGPVSHTGVRVTLCDGTQWLIHKGGDYGVSSQTVVVNAKNMSSEWKLEETKVFDGSKTVSDFVKVGGEHYNWLLDNCHNASGQMMKQ